MRADGMTDDTDPLPESVATLRDRYVLAIGGTTGEILDEGRTIAKVEEVAATASAFADREVGDWRSRPDSPKTVACRAGCSFCCYVPISTTIPEAIRIAETLRFERTPEELADIWERVERSEQARAGLAGKPRDQVRHACPLLDPGRGECSLYEARPLVCRGWNSLDVSRCEAFYDDPRCDAQIPTDGVQRTITLAIARGIGDGLRSRGLEGPGVDLAAALRILLDDPASADRWLAGEPAFRDAEVPGESRENA